MPAEQSWLLVSKPLRAPYRDGSTVLVRTLAAGLDDRFELSYFGDPAAPVRQAPGGEIIVAPTMDYAPGPLAKARILAALLDPRRRRLGLHFFFTPNRVTSRVVAALRRLQPSRPMVQSLMSSHEAARYVPLLRALDAVVVLSDHTREALCRAGLEPERVFRIYPGVEEVARVENPADNRALLYAGDLDADVVRRLVDIAGILGREELDGWRMYIAARPKGEDDEEHRDRLRRSLAGQLESGRVLLLGEVDDMNALMRRCSVQIFPADHVRRKVDLPLVLLEGMARGLGLVTLDFEPMSEIFHLARGHDLEPGVALPLTASADSPETLARAMVVPQTLLRWGRDAHELIRRELTSEGMLRQYENMYEEIQRASVTSTGNREYYDAFSSRYDEGRSEGYHKLIDDQAAEIVRRVGEDQAILEVGCGTGLILRRVARFAASAQGVDLSPGMLERARERGLDVREGSATELPHEDSSFDVAYSFKVLSHIPDFDACVREMLRVVRPGGYVVFDVYNRHSLRYLIKRFFGPRHTSDEYDEGAISTRFWSAAEAEARLPRDAKLLWITGIRVATVHPGVHRVPLLGALTERLEWYLMDSRLSRYAGFLVFVLEKTT